jgi:hypothetical protein
MDKIIKMFMWLLGSIFIGYATIRLRIEEWLLIRCLKRCSKQDNSNNRRSSDNSCQSECYMNH